MIWQYPQFDPVAFYFFKWPIHWYGLMYLFGLGSAWILLSQRLRCTKSPLFAILDQEQLSDLLFYAGLGMVIGGRVGYMLFYDWHSVLKDPLLIFQTWKGGMSFHGGLLGVLLALWFFARKTRQPYLALTDFIAPVVPIGLGAGRIGNFINGELWGRITQMPWGMVFPYAGSDLRHPSQLYEAGLEGGLLFLILWVYSSRPRPMGVVSAWFAVLYGGLRCFSEFFREPDTQIGYLTWHLTEGQWLSIPLIGIGLILLIHAFLNSGSHETLS